MLVKIRNPLETCREITNVSSSASAGDSSLTVKNNGGFATNDYIVIGKLGEDTTELKQVASISGANTVVLTSSVSFSHGVGDIVYIIPENQIEVSSKSSESGSFSVLATVDIEADELNTIYDDIPGQTSDFYRVRFKNETTGQFTGFSAILKGTGFTSRALKPMIDTILRRLGDPKGEFTSREDVLQEIIYKYEEVYNSLIQSSSEYYRKTVELPTEPFQYEYVLPDDFMEVHEIRDGGQVVVPPSPNDVLGARGIPGYEMVDRLKIYFNDVPTPVVTSTSTTTTTTTTTSTSTTTTTTSTSSTTTTTTSTSTTTTTTSTSSTTTTTTSTSTTTTTT